MDRPRSERRALPWRQARAGAVRSGVARETRLPRAASGAARRDARSSSTGEQTFGFIPIRRRVDTERVAGIDEQRAAVLSINPAAAFERRPAERVHRAIAGVRGTRVLPARHARAVWKKWLQPPSFYPHHIVRRQVTWDFDDGHDRVSASLAQYVDGIAYVIRLPERRRWLKQNNDLGRPTLPGDFRQGMLDHRHHRRVIRREGRGAHKRHFETRPSSSFGDLWRVGAEDDAIERAGLACRASRVLEQRVTGKRTHVLARHPFRSRTGWNQAEHKLEAHGSRLMAANPWLEPWAL